MTKLVIDYDGVIFKSACVAQSTSIRVKLKKDNSEFVFKNKTEVHGRDRKKSGGWLASQGLTLDDVS